jgi:hypothetical protein
MGTGTTLQKVMFGAVAEKVSKAFHCPRHVDQMQF